jgi:hypothetical protein
MIFSLNLKLLQSLHSNHSSPKHAKILLLIAILEIDFFNIYYSIDYSMNNVFIRIIRFYNLENITG